MRLHVIARGNALRAVKGGQKIDKMLQHAAALRIDDIAAKAGHNARGDAGFLIDFPQRGLGFGLPFLHMAFGQASVAGQLRHQHIKTLAFLLTVKHRAGGIFVLVGGKQRLLG